jgi:tripartite-type tricarboxylate transporter receptor subunit TctC
MPTPGDVDVVMAAEFMEAGRYWWTKPVAPKGTPNTIIAKLNSAVTEILRDPDIQAQYLKLGVQPAPMDVPSTAKFIDEERARWGDIIKSTDVTID